MFILLQGFCGSECGSGWVVVETLPGSAATRKCVPKTLASTAAVPTGLVTSPGDPQWDTAYHLTISVSHLAPRRGQVCLMV